MRIFDVCVLVAANESQAHSIRELVRTRVDAGLYPRELEFIVLSDPEHGRVGSGGATIRVLHALRERIKAGMSLLVIHAGGESRRMPTYAPEGKLFAPIPLSTSSVIPPVILDLQLSLFLTYPWLPGEVIVSSGDVAIDFDAGLVPHSRGEIYGFAKAESFLLGSHHGVFKFDKNRANVTDFYQKESPEFLAENAPLEGSRECALDLGIIGLAPGAVARLLRLTEAKTTSGAPLIDELEAGEVYLDLYVEILIASLRGLSFEQYCAKVSHQTALAEHELRLVFDALNGVDLHATVVKKASFLHFGSLAEYPESCRALADEGFEPFYQHDDPELRAVSTPGILQFNSSSCTVAGGASEGKVCLEGCRDLAVLNARGDNLLAGLENRELDFALPEGICLDERRTDSGIFLLAYHRDDTWKPAKQPEAMRFCDTPLDRWLADRGLAIDEVFDGPPYDLYDARLWLADAPTTFVEGYWRTDADSSDWRDAFRSSRRWTLKEIGALSAAQERERTRMDIRTRLVREEIVSSRGWLSVPEWDFRRAFSAPDLPVLQNLYRGGDDDLLRLYRRRLLCSLDDQTLPAGDPQREDIPTLKVEYLDRGVDPRRLRRGVKLDQIVWARAPVRLDLAGGWTDTPPFTLREGGEVVNLAVDLNGQPPVQVFCRATPERTVHIQSIDVGARELITDFTGIEGYSDPGSPFALPKAALCLLGLNRADAGRETLAEALEEIGCGLEITLLSAIPKGSGLGTSSILAATILGALERFFGLTVELGELIRQVLQIEQMLTTGGGWQDQIGGVKGGVKYIQTEAGLRPEPIIYQLDPHLFSNPASSRLFTLYYTGVTRLAKNILREVVDRVNTLEPAYLFTLRRLKTLARAARDAISLRDRERLAEILRASWNANKLIHPSTTNDEVESLLASVAGLFDGMKLLGAGGGGYVLFLSRTADDADGLRDRLSAFEHERARIVDMTLNPNGLQVSVS